MTHKTAQEEVAGLSQGNPLIYDSYLDKTRYEMYLIAMRGQ